MAFLLLSVSAYAQTAPAAWIDVPFVPQPRDGCGAASISMVMQYWAEQQHTPAKPDSDVASIQRALYSPKDHGIPAAAMQRYLRAHGFLAFAFNGTWSDIDQQVRKGRPLIVGVKPEGQAEFHYVVIDGIDSVNALVTMNDPAERKLLTQGRSGFEKEWSATRNWMLLAVPAPASH